MNKLVEGERYLLRDKHDSDLIEIGVFCQNGMFSTHSGYQLTTAFDLAIPLDLALKAEKMRAEVEMLRAGVEVVNGHGITLPRTEAHRSEDYMDGYRRGVDSQRWAMRKEMERWREDNPELAALIADAGGAA